MSEWNYARNSVADSLWGAPNHLHAFNAVGKNYRWPLPYRQKRRNILVDYPSISGYNKNIENSPQIKTHVVEVFYYG